MPLFGTDLTRCTFKTMLPAYLAQDTPVQNTWYTVLNTTPNVRIRTLSGALTAGADETVEIRITVDGVTIPAAGETWTAGTFYTIYRQSDLSATNCGVLYKGTGTGNVFYPLLIEGRSVKVEVRKTTANGASTLKLMVLYEQRV